MPRKRLDLNGKFTKEGGYTYYTFRDQAILIKKIKNKDGKFRFQVDLGVNPKNGKWERRSFKTLGNQYTVKDPSKAQDEGAYDYARRHINEICGEKATKDKEAIPAQRTTLTPAQREDAEVALGVLEKYKSVSLVRAAAFYDLHHKDVVGDESVEGCVDAYLKERLELVGTGELRKVSYDSYVAWLNPFRQKFGSKHIGAITAKDVTKLLDGKKADGSPKFKGTHRKNVLLRVNAVFKHAILREVLTESPMNKVRNPKLPKNKKAIFKVADVRKMFNACDEVAPDLKSFLIMGFFAGVRSGEIQKLTWDMVNWESRMIEIPSDESKKLEERHIQMTDNLLAMLAPYRNQSGPVVPFCPNTLKAKRTAVHKKAKVAKVRNGMRHSYASYHLNAFNDMILLMDNLGHYDFKMTQKHYRRRVAEGTGAEYFAIGLNSSKVVAFPVEVAS